MRRWMWAVVAAALLGTACTGDPTATSPVGPTTTAEGAPATSPDAAPTGTAPPRQPPPEAVDARLRREIVGEGVTRTRAEQLFAATIGPLPGVAVPAGEVDPSLDANDAIALLAPFFEELTPAQQAAMAELLGWDGAAARAAGRDDPDVATATDAPGQATGTTVDAGPTPAARPASFGIAAEPTLAELRSEALTARAEVAAVLGAPGPPDIEVGRSPTANDETYASATTWWHDGATVRPYPGDACHIEFYEDKMTGLDPTRRHAIIQHEVVHCFQHQVAGSEAALRTVPGWIIEGQAFWAMEQLTPTTPPLPPVEKAWFGYGMNPATRLFTRGNDGLGFWGHLGDVLGNQALVWPRLLPAYRAAIGWQHEAGFGVAVAGVRDRFLTTWGASYLRRPGHADWDMAGPGSVVQGRPSPRTLEVQPSQAAGFAIPMWTNESAEITSGADLVQITLHDGWGKVSDRPFGLDTALDWGSTRTLCLRDGGCACPAGTAGDDLDATPAQPPLSLGLTAGPNTGVVSVLGRSLDDFCRTPRTEGAPPPGTGDNGGGGMGGTGGGGEGDEGSGGTSTGDPHLRTIDGRFYDLMTVGEHTLVRSTVDDFVVQVRQEPLEGSRVVSMNTAVATRVGSRRVTVTLEDGEPVVRVDGRIQDGLAPGDDLALDGGHLSSSLLDTGPAHRIEQPDGTLVIVSALGRWGLGVTVRPAAGRAGALEGLLGDGDGDPTDDLPVDGSGAAMGQQQLTEEWGPRWRIDGADSLFDYDAGKDTSSYDDPTFPDAATTLDDLPGREEAEGRCRAAGIVDRTLLGNCTLDVALTGSAAFVDVHAAEEVRARAVERRRLAQFGSTVLQGEVTGRDEQPVHRFLGEAGQSVVIGGDGCEDSGLAVSVAAPDGTSLVDQFGCSAGRIDLPATGEYAVTVNSLADGTGPYTIPMRGVRPDRSEDAAIGATLVGTIDDPEARDRWFFEAGAGESVRIDPGDCVDAGIPVALRAPDDRQLAVAVGCDLPATVLPLDGTYQLIVNPNGGASGSYVLPLRRA